MSAVRRGSARGRLAGRLALWSLLGVVGAGGLGGCGSGTRLPEPLTLVSSFPEGAVAVCFVRADDGAEIGCTTEARPQRADGGVDFDGATLDVGTVSPGGLVAVVRTLGLDVPPDRVVEIRAFAYNEAGASEPSAQVFRITRTTRELRDNEPDFVRPAQGNAARSDTPG